MITFKLMWRW